MTNKTKDSASLICIGIISFFAALGVTGLGQALNQKQQIESLFQETTNYSGLLAFGTLLMLVSMVSLSMGIYRLAKKIDLLATERSTTNASQNTGTLEDSADLVSPQGSPEV